MKSENGTQVSHDAQIQHCIENLHSPNPRQRSQAAQELGDLKDELSIPALITALQQDVNTYVRSAAAEALGHIGSPEAIFPLMDALHDPSSFVRRAAAIALGQMQAKEAQGALLQALDDPNFYVRRAAINAIGKLGIPSLGPVLLPLLEISDSRIQRTTIIALRRLKTRQAIPKMIAILEQHNACPSPRDLPLVKTLVIALGDLHAQEAVTTLIRVIRGYVGARSLSATALGQIGDPRAGPALVEALRDKSTNLQLAALKSLGKLRYREAAPKVQRFLSSPDPRKRRVAAQTLGQLQDEAAIPELLKIARSDTSPLVRPAAVEALGNIGNVDLLPDLLPLVEDTNAYLRATLANTLCSLHDGSNAAYAALQQLAEDNVEHVALSARQAIQNLEDGEDNSPVELTTDKNPGDEYKLISWLRRLSHRLRHL